MSSKARFIEHDTGTEVLVETVFGWGDKPNQSIVEYPSGRRFGVSEELLAMHFSIVTPQEIFFQAYGIDERPTKKQAMFEDVLPKLRTLLSPEQYEQVADILKHKPGG